MLLRVVCQVCGKTEIIDLDKPILPFPRWDYYKLSELVDDRSLIDGFEDYRIWICPECHERVTKFFGLVIKKKGEYYGNLEINWEKLSKMVEKSLRGGDKC